MVESYFFLITGILIVCCTAFDFFYTTISFRGAGPMTKITTDATSAVFLFLNRHSPNRIILSFAGVVHILFLTCLWIGLLWVGLFLILSSSDIAIVHAVTQKPANWVNLLYYSGYILTTLGNGDFVPSSGGWQIVTVIFSFSGFIFITITVSYLVNLNSTVLYKRTVAQFISNLGSSAEEIVINTYSGGDFSQLIRLIPRLQEKLNRINQNHFAYPVSHYFTSISAEDSLPVNLFNLDEALTIIKYQVEKDPSLEDNIRPLRDAIEQFLNTIKYSFVAIVQDDKKLSLDREKLKRIGISLVDHPNINKDCKSIKDRRFLFYGFLKSNGWNLDDVYLDHIEKPNSQTE